MTRLHPSNLGRSAQRLLVLVALSAVAVAAAITAAPDGRPTAADAFAPSNPFSCGANDTSPTSYGNRQPVGMWNGNMSSPAMVGTTYPCLSGVGLTLNVPANGGASISSINLANDIPNHTITVADGTTIGNVYHLGFLGFSINSTETGATLSTSSGTATPYSLTLSPQNGATLGGNGVVTDLLVDGSSNIVVTGLPLAFLSCPLLGGSGSDPCSVNVNQISSSLVSFAGNIGITTLSIKSMTLKIYYVSTHTPTGGNPSGASLQFPNTTITVGGS